MERTLHAARVAIFGVNCIGGYAAEILEKNGVGYLELIDDGKAGLSHSGCFKTEGDLKSMTFRTKAEQLRLHKLYPDVNVQTKEVLFTLEEMSQFDFGRYSYVVDASGIWQTQAAAAFCALKENVPFISCLNIKNRSNPTQLKLSTADEIPDAAVRIQWKALIGEGQNLQCKFVCSDENPVFCEHRYSESSCKDCACPAAVALGCSRRKLAGTSCNAYVSSMAGMMIGEAILLHLSKHGFE